MEITGTLVNYFFHCKRQCYLFGNYLNMEDNSEEVKIGKAIHEEYAEKNINTELQIEHIKIDRLSKEYLTEIKKSDADKEAAKWQLIYYLYVLKRKGVDRKGKLEFVEKNRNNNKTICILLTDKIQQELIEIMKKIKILLESDQIPETINDSCCKKCAYYEYCYI